MTYILPLSNTTVNGTVQVIKTKNVEDTEVVLNNFTDGQYVTLELPELKGLSRILVRDNNGNIILEGSPANNQKCVVKLTNVSASRSTNPWVVERHSDVIVPTERGLVSGDGNGSVYTAPFVHSQGPLWDNDPYWPGSKFTVGDPDYGWGRTQIEAAGQLTIKSADSNDYNGQDLYLMAGNGAPAANNPGQAYPGGSVIIQSGASSGGGYDVFDDEGAIEFRAVSTTSNEQLEPEQALMVINSQGAIGFDKGFYANKVNANYGQPGDVLTSNGPDNPPFWSSQKGSTPPPEAVYRMVTRWVNPYFDGQPSGFGNVQINAFQESPEIVNHLNNDEDPVPDIFSFTQEGLYAVEVSGNLGPINTIWPSGNTVFRICLTKNGARTLGSDNFSYSRFSGASSPTLSNELDENYQPTAFSSKFIVNASQPGDWIFPTVIAYNQEHTTEEYFVDFIVTIRRLGDFYVAPV